MVNGKRGLVSADPALVPGDRDDDWQHQIEHVALPVAASVADAEPVVGHVGVSAETYPSAPSLYYAAQNSKDRRVALQWLESKPLATVSVVRASMHPLCDYMCKQLSLGSVKWEQTAMLSNVSPAGVGSLTLRDFPLTIASEGTLNQAYFAELQTLFFSSAPWQAVPLHSWDVSLCSLAFRLLARQGCAVLQLGAADHEVFPTVISTHQAARTLAQHDLQAQLCAGCVHLHSPAQATKHDRG